MVGMETSSTFLAPAGAGWPGLSILQQFHMGLARGLCSLTGKDRKVLRCHEQDLRLGGVWQGTGCVLRRGGPSGSAAGNVYAATNSLHGREGTGWKQGGFGGRGDGDRERRQLSLTGGPGKEGDGLDDGRR